MSYALTMWELERLAAEYAWMQLWYSAWYAWQNPDDDPLSARFMHKNPYEGSFYAAMGAWNQAAHAWFDEVTTERFVAGGCGSD